MFDLTKIKLMKLALQEKLNKSAERTAQNLGFSNAYTKAVLANVADYRQGKITLEAFDQRSAAIAAEFPEDEAIAKKAMEKKDA